MTRRASRRLPPHIRQPSVLRRYGWVGGLLAIAVLSRLWPSVPLATPPTIQDDVARFDGQTVRVVRVVDGDTFDFAPPDGVGKPVRVRLWGVDTPEVKGPRTEAMHWGAEASAFAKTTLLEHDVRLELLPDRTRDRYDRLLVYAFLPDTPESFNELLVMRGHAYADTRFKHPRLDQFTAAEEVARKGRRGLWQAITPQQMPRWRRRILDARP